MKTRNIDPYSTDMFVAPPEVSEVEENTYVCTGTSNVVAFLTSEGIVLIDTGYHEDAERVAELLRRRTDQPIHTVVYTHGHADHAYNLDRFLTGEQERPRVIAHESMPDRFARYERSAGYWTMINARQFGGTPAAVDDYERDEAGHRGFGPPDLPPTTLYSSSMTISVGDTTFEIRHGRGETEDHSWVYCPERDVLCSGDFFTNVAPNAGNPQKLQRFPWEWADVLREMAGKRAEHLCPGHGAPVIGDSAGVETKLLTTADYLDAVVERTLVELNAGAPPDVDIVHGVDLPDPDEPWLEESYDEAEFVVRNVIKYYGGWWSGRPSELKPAPRAELASEISDLSENDTPLLDRARALADEGEYRLACHLADFALEADPDDPGVRSIVERIYRERAETEENLMAGNIYSSAAEYAREGRPFR